MKDLKIFRRAPPPELPLNSMRNSLLAVDEKIHGVIAKSRVRGGGKPLFRLGKFDSEPKIDFHSEQILDKMAENDLLVSFS